MMLRIGISAVSASNDGMTIHYATLLDALRHLGNIELISDTHQKKANFLEQFDYIFRYGWPTSTSSGFHDANFLLNLSEDSRKNILVAPFAIPMLHTQSIEIIANHFTKVLYDSSYSKAAGDSILKATSSYYVNPSLRDIRFNLQTSSVYNNNKYRFLHISNSLYWVKGVDIILESFLKAFTASDDVELIMVLKDKNEKFKDFQGYFKNYNRQHQITLVENSIDHSRISELYTTSDCYVCASRYDTFSLPTLEAAALGLTIIAHKFGGMRDYLDMIGPEKYIELDMQQTVIPNNAWRGNREIDSMQPTTDSLVKSFKRAYSTGKLRKKPNSKLVEKFSQNHCAIQTLKELLA